MIHEYSLKIKLDDVIRNINYEQKVMENIRYCNNLSNKKFKLIFWHEDMNEQEIEDFVKRNQKVLFEVNTEITRNYYKDAWFVIDENKKEKTWRYMYDGGILEGITEYIKIIKHIKKRDNR